nr:uncharacterized protein LOC114926121 [Arachis hypogaea]
MVVAVETVTQQPIREEEFFVKLLEFLESPHTTTNVLLADKEQFKLKENQPCVSDTFLFVVFNMHDQYGKLANRKQSSDVEEDDKDKVSDAEEASHDDEDVGVPNDESEEENKLEEEEEKPSTQKRTHKKIAKDCSTDKAGEKSTSGKGKGSKKSKKELSREDMHAVVVDILKEVDFNTI